ncbi:TIR domain-containing protein [Bradyrhizobium sp. AUGA SZCCT0240]|uniref:nSTAND1 domain-containing NTPase n=1 Tax=Bradyrhizobium sp. AUGA SZCCT0240 TaxID=2807669 RepID=UPI001BAD7B53|nr:TIR domain-containing protein [Bradyrhizobium sp. AUGA SZCCT0240]MBR1255187.1 TIR domain-containing protein [Bradyrhizobium sp. AUGA SZCCT0240]
MRVFVSFASKDRVAVRQLEAQLRIRRPEISFFVDERGLTGGVYWIPRLGEELGKSDVVLLVLGDIIGPWQELEYYEALQLSRLTNRGGRPRIVPVVIADRPSPGLAFLSTLHQIVALDPANSSALLAIEKALSAVPAQGVIEPWRRFQPYKGLPALTDKDAAFFFGREQDTMKVLELLARSRRRIIALIGQSGVGKSSLVSAGILSRLKSQLSPLDGALWPAGLKESRSYVQLTMRPGRNPVKELAVSLVKLYRTDDAAIDKEASDWTQRFREGSHLHDMLRLTCDKIAETQGGYPPKRFVLYVDQGEELYTRAKEKDEARLFSRLLADAAGDETFSILISMRSDFYPDFQNDEAIFGLSEKFDVLPLTHDVLTDIIRKPAEVLGARFEDRNIPSLIADATREPGALPLLSDLLQEMWLNMLSRGDGVLRWSDQPGIVDIGLPLKRRADAFLEQPTIDTNVVRRLFTLRLAQVTQVGEPVRRRARRSECTSEEWSVAEQLAGSEQRLLTISNPLLGGEPIVEVAHEQLLQRWPRLKGWLDEQREFLIWRTETEIAALAYQKLPDAQKPDEVLSGLRLTKAEAWYKQRVDDLPTEVRSFVAASLARRDELLDQKKREDALKIETENRLKQTELERERLARIAAEKAHELERERANNAEQVATAEAERRVRDREEQERRIHYLQELERERANIAEQKAARAREQEAAARKLSWASFAAAVVLLCLTVLAILGFYSARRATEDAIANESRALAALSAAAINRRSGTDGAELALAAWPRNSSDSRPQLEVALRALAKSIALKLEVVTRMMHEGAVRGALYDHNGHILSWSDDRTLRVWDVATGAPVGPAMKHDGPVTGAQFSHNERRILSWSKDKTVRLWDAVTGSQTGLPMSHGGVVGGALFSHKEEHVLSWSHDRTLRLWDATTGTPVGASMKHDGPVNGALFSREGHRILSWSEDGSLRQWDGTTGEQIGSPLRHEGAVNGALFNRNGDRVLSWSRDKTLRLWNVATGAPIGVPMKHDGPVTGAVFNWSGDHILSWAEDGTLRQWDARTGSQIGSPMKHDGAVTGALFSNNDKRILSWSRDHSIRLWDAATGAQSGPPMHHDGFVNGALFPQIEGHILSWSDDGTLRMWDAATGGQIGPVMQHDGQVLGARLGLERGRIFSWSFDGALRLWDLATGASIIPAMKHDAVSGATFSKNEERILSWSHDGTLRLWDAATGSQTGSTMEHGGIVTRGLFDPNGTHILSLSTDGNLRLWTSVGSPYGLAMKHSERVNGACFSTDGARILSWSDDGTVRQWMAQTGAPVGNVLKHDGPVIGAVFSRDGKRVLSWSEDGSLKLWDDASEVTMKHEGPVYGALFSQNDQRILSWSTDTLRLWDANTGTQIGPAMAHGGPVNGAILSQDEGRILAWSDDRTIRLWEVATGRQIGSAMTHNRPVTGALFSQDETRILSWSEDSTLRLWDAARGTQIGPPMKHEMPVTGATFSRDERRILSWSDDATLRLWDIATDAQIGPMMTHERPVSGALFSRDGRRILSWSNDNTLRVWDAGWRGSNLFEIACNHLPVVRDLARLSGRYGVRISDPICEATHSIPVPDWTRIVPAP